MGPYSDHTGELPKGGREASGLSGGHRGNLSQHSSAWGHRNRLLCKHQTWVREDIVNPRSFDAKHMDRDCQGTPNAGPYPCTNDPCSFGNGMFLLREALATVRKPAAEDWF